LRAVRCRIILPLPGFTVKARMPDRLLIVRPPALGTALADAVARACARPIAVAASDIPLLDARLACGDFDAVRVLLRTAVPAPELPLFVARYAMWTGDLQSAAGAWAAVLASLDLNADRMSVALRRTARIEIAQTATDLGDAPLAGRLLGSARNADPADTANPAAPPDPDPDSTMICDVAFNVLGLQPDAVRGRLRLRPRLDRFAEIEALNIHFGGGSVRVSATRDGAAIVLRIEQDAGGIPITVLLEPFVDSPETADVDGRRAQLMPRNVDGGTIVPVQLVLDQVRTLVVHTRAPGRT
jgi:hypothetical protein